MYFQSNHLALISPEIISSKRMFSFSLNEDVRVDINASIMHNFKKMLDKNNLISIQMEFISQLKIIILFFR